MTKSTSTKSTKAAAAKAPAQKADQDQEGLKAVTESGEARQLSQEQIAALTAAPEGAVPSPGVKPSRDRTRLVVGAGPEVESVRVKIKRNELTTIPKRVFSHEIVILQAIHGEENIEVVEDSELQLPLIGDAQDELDRLIRVYGRKQSAVVLAQYSSARVLAEELGIKAPAVRRATKHGVQTKQASGQRGAGVA
jgi:hypothetical protein